MNLLVMMLGKCKNGKIMIVGQVEEFPEKKTWKVFAIDDPHVVLIDITGRN